MLLLSGASRVGKDCGVSTLNFPLLGSANREHRRLRSVAACSLECHFSTRASGLTLEMRSVRELTEAFSRDRSADTVSSMLSADVDSIANLKTSPSRLETQDCRIEMPSHVFNLRWQGYKSMLGSI